MPDVYLLTEGPEGEVAVPGLSLRFHKSGLDLAKSDGEPVWDSDWDGLEELTPEERSVLPDGRDGVVVVVIERGGRPTHRFVLATDDAVATETALREWAAEHGLRTRASRRAVSRLLTVGIVLAAAAAIAALLLSANHIIHF